MDNNAEKKCPFCGESIKAEAIKCRFCGERLDISPEELEAQTRNPKQTPVGHAVQIDTELLFEGTVSRLVMFWPTVKALILVAGAVLIAWLGPRYSARLEPRVALMVAGGVAALALVYWLYRYLLFASNRYRITNDRIEYEKGIVSKSVLNLDLWKIQDLAFHQNFIDMLLGLGHIRIVSSDKDSPLILFGPVRHGKALFSRLQKAQMTADRRRGVLHVEN